MKKDMLSCFTRDSEKNVKSTVNIFLNPFQVSLPSFSLGLPAYYILASSEASSNLSRYDGIR
jgi:hypothetical protein